MPAPAPSHLDAAQVLPAAFEDATGSLRTTLAAGTTIVISDVDDSIKIGDGSGNYVGVTDGGLDSSILPLGTFQTSQVTVGTSAVAVAGTPLANRKSISLKSAGSIYIGNSSGVTTSTGFFISSGESVSMDLDAGQAIYAISGSSNQKLFVLELA